VADPHVMGTDRHNLDLDSTWANLSGTLHHKPAQFRRNDGMLSLRDDPAWSHEVRVAIRFNRVRDDGLPDGKEEYVALDAVEDLYRDALQRDGTAALALVITTDGIRDLIFYTCDPEAVIREFETSLKPATRTHNVELTIRVDPRWELYRRFA
jgi:hypothetical protein